MRALGPGRLRYAVFVAATAVAASGGAHGCATVGQHGAGPPGSGGGALFVVEPWGMYGKVLSGPVPPKAYDYAAQAEEGALGCDKRNASKALLSGARLVNAGRLLLRTESFRETQIDFFLRDRRYTLASGVRLHKPDDDVRVRAFGSVDAPAFLLQTRSPHPIALTEPASDAEIDRREDLVLRWPPREDGFVRVEVKAGGHRWYCGFDARAGSGVVPSADLADERPGTLVLKPSVVRVTSTDVGNFHVTLSVSSDQSQVLVTMR